MTTAAIAFADFCDVVCARLRRPRIRADRDLRTLRSARERDGVSCLRIEIIRDELVEAFVTFVNQVKLNHAVGELCFSSHGLQGFEMLLKDGLKTTLHFRASGDCCERMRREIANDLFDESVV